MEDLGVEAAERLVEAVERLDRVQQREVGSGAVQGRGEVQGGWAR